LFFLTFYGHIKTTEQRTIIQQYGDWYQHWLLILYRWAVTFGTATRGLVGLRPRPASLLARCTKCNSPPINYQSQFTKLISFDVAL